jgi:hypothetical protein
MKTCIKCKVEKELSEFAKKKDTKDGLRYNCKSCYREYYQANKEKISKQKKEYYQANKEKISKYRQDNKENINKQHKKYYQDNKENFKKYYQANKEKISKQKKEYRQANKEKIKEKSKEYYQDNKESINKRKKEYYQVNKENINHKQNEYTKERRKNDHLYKMRCNLRTRSTQAFKKKCYYKNNKTQEMLGVDWKIAKAHIERQFTKGMNWNNYGEWHIDHIIPLASANTKEELKKLCHYTNLQPLWAKDNLIKSNKIDNQQIILII